MHVYKVTYFDAETESRANRSLSTTELLEAHLNLHSMPGQVLHQVIQRFDDCNKVVVIWRTE